MLAAQLRIPNENYDLVPLRVQDALDAMLSAFDMDMESECYLRALRASTQDQVRAAIREACRWDE